MPLINTAKRNISKFKIKFKIFQLLSSKFGGRVSSKILSIDQEPSKCIILEFVFHLAILAVFMKQI